MKFRTLNLLVLNFVLTASSKEIDFAVGGQAVIEGVMMRSPSSVTIAVRKSEGQIKVRRKRYFTLIQRFPWLNIPILRGVINLFEMMIIGTEAINYSANESLDEPEQKPKKKKKDRTKLEAIFEVGMFILSLVIALSISIFLFKFLPLLATTFIEGYSVQIQNNYILFNLIDGILKMSIFLIYIYVLALFPSFKRIFEYHGAEHKAIFNYEAKLPLTVENSARQTRFHPRCGTSFILIVFIISILAYTFVPKQETFTANLLLRLVCLPLIAGISYEFLKFSAKHVENPIVKALIQPGLWFQRLTTREPDASQLEVSIASLKEALEMERLEMEKAEAKS